MLFGLPGGTHTPPDDGRAPHLPLPETSFDTATLSLAPGTMSSIAATSTSSVAPLSLSAPPLSLFSVPSSSTTPDDTHPSTDSIFDDFFRFDEEFDFTPASFATESTPDAAIGSLTSSTMTATAALPPNTISLDGDPPPRRPPPLVPRFPEAEAQRTFLSPTPTSLPNTDESDSDATASRLLASLHLKRKTPTPDVSSEEVEPRAWFSTSSQPSSSTSSRKRVRTSTVDRVESTGTEMASALMKKLQFDQEKIQDRRVERTADRDLKRWSRQEKELGSDRQRDHERDMQQRQHDHERVMAREAREKLQLELEIQRLKVQEQAMKHGHGSGEDDVMRS